MAKRTFEEIVEAQGWNTESINCLLLQYIENQQSDDAFLDFMEEAAANENSEEEIEAPDGLTDDAASLWKEIHNVAKDEPRR